MAVGGSTLGAPAQAASPVAAALALHVEDAIINAPSPMKVLLDAKRGKDKAAQTSQVSGALWLHPAAAAAHNNKRGKEGSRRRRRYDNVHFVHHPLVAKHVGDAEFVSRNDRSPGLPVPRPESPFTALPRGRLGELPTLANATTIKFEDVTTARPAVMSPGENNLTRNHRRLLKTVRRTRCGEEIVKRVDDEILARVFCISGEDVGRKQQDGDENLTADLDAAATGATRLTEDWVVLHPRRPDSPVLVPAAAQIAATPPAHSPPLCLEISDKFLRLLVHLMCRFYGLVSQSTDECNGTRVTYIRPRAALLAATAFVAAEAEADGQVAEQQHRRSILAAARPSISFSDYLFA
ncbi:hypothetical protein HDU86_001619 [Geranomyces michiganensis]|nr:hypothetical protein HDU86_001619 [Geranomyces michiganensis]